MGKTIKADDSLLTASQLSPALSLTVQDATGAAHSLSSLLASRPTLLILVRHFHCGFCTAYLADVARRFEALGTPEARADPKGPQVIVVGHGKHDGIKRYREIIPDEKEFPFGIYTDPKRKLYKALGVVNENLDMGKSKDLPKHISSLPALRIVLTSTLESLTSGALMWKGGPISVLGADFLFDAQGNNTFAHRMVNTRDHTDVDVLADKWGVGASGVGEGQKKEEVQEEVQDLQGSEAVQRHADAVAGEQQLPPAATAAPATAAAAA